MAFRQHLYSCRLVKVSADRAGHNLVESFRDSSLDSSRGSTSTC